ncbi:hypothetical protein [Sulfurovum sp.]|uniref:hypothetical protein n=1 Tax=Sulfurovum sp. TaxID=1969726 RepID=UPI0025E62140|nr:hypothetical protein [Sulfurovum sp.]
MYTKPKKQEGAMKEIIEYLKEAISTSDDFLAMLQHDERFCWQADYPVAVVHHQSRIKDAGILSALKEKKMLDEKGFTPTSWSAQRIEEMKALAPNYVKTVTMLVHTGNEHAAFLFSQKHPGDYWKKVTDDGSFIATVEYSRFGPKTDMCQAETKLRNLMRSSKEVPSLKEIAYIWVAEAPAELELDRVLAHYYRKNWMMVVRKEKIVYIGWSERLGSVNMRHFVCPPKPKRSKENA